MSKSMQGRIALVTGASRGIGRAATPQEIAWMAAFLASDKSAYTTVTVDGGGTSRRGAF